MELEKLTINIPVKKDDFLKICDKILNGIKNINLLKFEHSFFSILKQNDIFQNAIENFMDKNKINIQKKLDNDEFNIYDIVPYFNKITKNIFVLSKLVEPLFNIIDINPFFKKNINKPSMAHYLQTLKCVLFNNIILHHKFNYKNENITIMNIIKQQIDQFKNYKKLIKLFKILKIIEKLNFVIENRNINIKTTKIDINMFKLTNKKILESLTAKLFSSEKNDMILDLLINSYGNVDNILEYFNNYLKNILTNNLLNNYNLNINRIYYHLRDVPSSGHTENSLESMWILKEKIKILYNKNIHIINNKLWKLKTLDTNYIHNDYLKYFPTSPNDKNYNYIYDALNTTVIFEYIVNNKTYDIYASLIQLSILKLISENETISFNELENGSNIGKNNLINIINSLIISNLINVEEDKFSINMNFSLNYGHLNIYKFIGDEIKIISDEELYIYILKIIKQNKSIMFNQIYDKTNQYCSIQHLALCLKNLLENNRIIYNENLYYEYNGIIE